jgi:hypothetical protein
MVTNHGHTFPTGSSGPGARRAPSRPARVGERLSDGPRGPRASTRAAPGDARAGRDRSDRRGAFRGAESGRLECPASARLAITRYDPSHVPGRSARRAAQRHRGRHHHPMRPHACGGSRALSGPCQHIRVPGRDGGPPVRLPPAQQPGSRARSSVPESPKCPRREIASKEIRSAVASTSRKLSSAIFHGAVDCFNSRASHRSCAAVRSVLVGRGDWVRLPLPPNRTGGSPASGSPVDGWPRARTDRRPHGL